MRSIVNTKKGFSIGEVLIAMFILLVGIVDAVFLTARSIDDLGNSRDAVVASLLAQEGTELVRNVRDNNVTETTCGPGGDERCTAFDENYGFLNNGVCTADFRLGLGNGGQGSLDCSGASSDPELYFDPDTGLYQHSSGENIKKGYQRKIFIAYGHTDPITPTDDNKYADVTSVVIYGKGKWSDVNSDNIESTCLKSKNCAYAQTRLTSWINYGD